MRNNPNIDLVNFNAYAKLVKLNQFVLSILSGDEILTSIKGQNLVINLRKLTRNNLDLVNFSAYAKVAVPIFTLWPFFARCGKVSYIAILSTPRRTLMLACC